MATCVGNIAIDFLPNEKRGMAHVVCDQLARLTYESPSTVFISRLMKLRELSEEWEAADISSGRANANKSSSSVIAANEASGKGVSVAGKAVGTLLSTLPEFIQQAQNVENGNSRKQLSCGSAVTSGSLTLCLSSTGAKQPKSSARSMPSAKMVADMTPGMALAPGRAKANIQCPQCPRKFCFMGNMLRHCNQEHGQDRELDSTATMADEDGAGTPQAERGAQMPGLLCPICNRKFYYRGCLLKHQEQHHGLRKPVAQNALTPWLETQPAIAEEVAQMSLFQCTECDRTFESLNSLCWHVRVHYVRAPKYHAQSAATQNNNGPYQCPVCDRHFTTELDLSTHMTENADAHECADCGRRIESALYLRVHQITHRGHGNRQADKPAREPTACPICGRTMKSAANLHEHMASVHAPTKKFVCHVCAKQCARRGELTRHMLTHGGERRFECGTCGRRFRLRDMMRRHMRAVHARLRPHLCNLCGRPFAEKHQLNTHMKVHRV